MVTIGARSVLAILIIDTDLPHYITPFTVRNSPWHIVPTPSLLRPVCRPRSATARLSIACSAQDRAGPLASSRARPNARDRR